MVRGMGFSKPKAVTQTAAPPPVTTTGADVAAAAKQTRQDQKDRQGYAATLLSSPNYLGTTTAKPQKKTLLGGN